MSSEIWLVGPHAVELALQRHAERALELRVVRGEPERRLGGLIEQARRLGVAVQRSDADALARFQRKKNLRILRSDALAASGLALRTIDPISWLAA